MALWAVILLVAFLLAALLVCTAYRSSQHLENASMMVVLGSGGHTAEMLGVLRAMPFDR